MKSVCLILSDGNSLVLYYDQKLSRTVDYAIVSFSAILLKEYPKNFNFIISLTS